MSAQRNKTCFVIGEIGDVGSQTRMRADWVFENIIRKAVEERGYHPIRSDKVAKPGCMTPQMMTLLYESPLVIADLTNLNSNVFYELAIRHITEKATIHIIEGPQKPPFNLEDYRTIYFRHTPREADECKNTIVQAIVEIEKDEADGFRLESPISPIVDNIKGTVTLIEGAKKLRKEYANIRMPDAIRMQAIWNAKYPDVKEYFEAERDYLYGNHKLSIERLINVDAIDKEAYKDFSTVVREIWQRPNDKERYSVCKTDLTEFDFNLIEYRKYDATKIKALIAFNDPLENAPSLGIVIDPERSPEFGRISYTLRRLFERLWGKPWELE